jgi:CRP-like cAMP-binding protein
MSKLDVEVSPALVKGLEAIGSKISFNAGEVILQEGDPGKGIFLLLSGSARLSMSSHNGGPIELRKLGPGAFVGLSSTLSCDHCCYTVEACEAAELMFVPAQRAQEFLRTRTDLCLQVIQLLGQEMSSLCNERALINARSQPVSIRA